MLQNVFFLGGAFKNTSPHIHNQAKAFILYSVCLVFDYTYIYLYIYTSLHV